MIVARSSSASRNRTGGPPDSRTPDLGSHSRIGCRLPRRRSRVGLGAVWQPRLLVCRHRDGEAGSRHSRVAVRPARPPGSER
jgi:hypothetical protein